MMRAPLSRGTDAYRRAAMAAEVLGQHRGSHGRRPEALAEALALLQDAPAIAPHRSSARATVEEPAVTIRLTGKVGADRAAGGAYFDHASVARQLRVADPSAHVRVEIDSTGGTTEEALAIYSLLRAHRGLVTTFATNSCRSAATIVFMAGAWRVARADTRFLIHGSAYPDGYARAGHVGASELAEDATYLQRLNETILRIYADRATASEDRLRQIFNGGREFDAATAQRLGIAHRVATEAPTRTPTRYR